MLKKQAPLLRRLIKSKPWDCHFGHHLDPDDPRILTWWEDEADEVEGCYLEYIGNNPQDTREIFTIDSPGTPPQSPETDAYTDESAEVQSPDQSDS